MLPAACSVCDLLSRTQGTAQGTTALLDKPQRDANPNPNELYRNYRLYILNYCSFLNQQQPWFTICHELS